MRTLLTASYNLDNLGLIAGMVDELGLSELIDIVIKQDHDQRQASVVQCPTMILKVLASSIEGYT